MSGNATARIIELEAEIGRLRERCVAYKGQVEAGAAEIELLRKIAAGTQVLLAEIDRLRAENRRLHDTRRWNIKPDGDCLLICVGAHDKNEPCEFFRYRMEPLSPQCPRPVNSRPPGPVAAADCIAAGECGCDLRNEQLPPHQTSGDPK